MNNMSPAPAAAVQSLVYNAEVFAGFTVQVAGGPYVSYITGTKMDGPAPVVFMASVSERANGTLDLRAQAMASDGEQATFSSAAELQDWLRTN